MKTFMEEYGLITVAAIIIMIFVLVATPIGTSLKNGVKTTVDKFTQSMVLGEDEEENGTGGSGETGGEEEVSFTDDITDYIEENCYYAYGVKKDDERFFTAHANIEENKMVVVKVYNTAWPDYSNHIISFYDENGKFIKYEKYNPFEILDAENKIIKTVSPIGAKEIRYTLYTTELGQEFCKTEVNSVIVPDTSELKYGHSLKTPFDFNGKTNLWFGDSITMGLASPNGTRIEANYVNKFAEYSGLLTPVNYGISGSCIVADDNTSICTNILNYSGEIKDFTFIAGGTNDYALGSPLGVFGDTTQDTFYGALYQICEKLKSDFVGSTIIFITPINRNANWTPQKVVSPLDSYRNAIFEMATSYGFNVVDGSQIGFPIESGEDADTLCSDGIHPTELGHDLYAKSLYEILLQSTK